METSFFNHVNNSMGDANDSNHIAHTSDRNHADYIEHTGDANGTNHIGEQKTALVTGASRGIGRAIALRLAKEGYHVYINARTSSDALVETSRMIKNCTIVAGDVGNSDDVRAIFQKIRETSDHLDVLVNNAGISYIGLLTDMSDAEWQNVISTNLSSVFYCCREALPAMLSAGGGRIVNISSMWGVSGASCEAAYSASKSGINGLTQALAREMAPSNIQINALACGVIDTEMNNQLSSDDRRELEEAIPAGRYGTPEEVADMVWNLVNAPAYLTGQIIGLAGGYIV